MAPIALFVSHLSKNLCPFSSIGFRTIGYLSIRYPPRPNYFSVGRSPVKSQMSALQPRVVEASWERVVPEATCLP